MRIEFLRLGDRLNIDWQIEDAKDSVRIPLLTLQPLLENAVYHGVAPLLEGGTIMVSLTYTQDSYTVKVSNPLPAQDLSQTVDSKYPSSQSRGNQLAIQNIRSRLDVLYGKRARLKTRVSDHEFVTEITLPKSPTAR
jgi:two-component system sensor histidine kinase AlgZ